MARVFSETLAPGVKVGGPCQSVSYMYAHDYGTFRGWTKFLQGTEGKMDFYSFHCYDYFGEVDETHELNDG